MKKPIPRIIILILFLQTTFGCFGQWNYDNSYDPIEAVSVAPYASVQDIPGQDSELCLGLAISGGGSRAQYFGTGVLMELSKVRHPNGKNFLNEVDYYSSVSGGSYAIGYYMMVRKIGQLKAQTYFDYWNNGVIPIPYHKDGLQSYVGVTSSPLAAFKLRSYEKRKKYKGSFPETIDYELLKGGNYRKVLGDTVPQLHLDDFFTPKCDTCKATSPIFVPNTTIYPNCERFPLMPHIIEDLKINKSIIPYYEFKDASGKLDDTGYRFPLAFSIAASSAVPGILPISKFGMSNSDLALRVVDGGIVDNLGYQTLFELLISDNTIKKNKKMLVIDCSGVGDQNRYTDSKDRIKMFENLTETSFFTVASKSLVAKKSIDLLFKADTIPHENYQLLGMQDIREKIKKNLTDSDKKKIEEYKHRWKIKKKLKKSQFNEMYWELSESFGKGKYCRKCSAVYLGSIITSQKLINASNAQKFLILELASQVITKVKIRSIEQESLMLAGRLLILENKEAIVKLLD